MDLEPTAAVADAPRWGAFSYPAYRRYWFASVCRVFGMTFRFIGAGWLVAVVTNQANVGRGLLSRQTLDGFHAGLVARVRALGGDIHGVFVCPHAPEEGCACRKPKPGLLEQLASELRVTPAQCLMVGDDLRDAHAAAAFGCDSARVLTGKGKAPSWAEHPAPGYDDLAAVVQSLLQEPLAKAPGVSD